MIYSTTDVTDWLGTINTEIMLIVGTQESLFYVPFTERFPVLRHVGKLLERIISGSQLVTLVNLHLMSISLSHTHTIWREVFITYIYDSRWRLMTSNTNDKRL